MNDLYKMETHEDLICSGCNHPYQIHRQETIKGEAVDWISCEDCQEYHDLDREVYPVQQ